MTNIQVKPKLSYIDIEIMKDLYLLFNPDAAKLSFSELAKVLSEYHKTDITERDLFVISDASLDEDIEDIKSLHSNLNFYEYI